MTANAWKWTGTIGVGILGGLVSYVTDNQHWTGWYDLARHCIIGIGTAIPALKMTLSK